jgi:site-specific recombinase XerD
MDTQPTTTLAIPLPTSATTLVPTLFTGAGEQASYRFIEYFTARIRNPNTRQAYFRAVNRFSQWCALRNLDLTKLNPVVIASYIEELQQELGVTSVKQHLSAIRMLFDYLVTGHIVPFNPAQAVQAPRYSASEGKTPILSAQETRLLLDSIDVTNVWGLRNRALIGVLVFSCARVSAVVGMKLEDYFQEGKEWKLRLHEKRGKLHVVPAHHQVIDYLDEYIVAAGLQGAPKLPLFRQFTRGRALTDEPMTRHAAVQMVKRYAQQAGLPESICCHTFRGTGITIALENGSTLEEAQRLANHADIRTTMLYDRRDKTVKRGVVERIVI